MDMHDRNLHPITGIPEEIIKILYGRFSGVIMIEVAAGGRYLGMLILYDSTKKIRLVIADAVELVDMDVHIIAFDRMGEHEKRITFGKWS